MRKKIAVCLILFLAVALYIGIPKLIPDEPYDLSEVPRFYMRKMFYTYPRHNTGYSFGPVRAPSDAIDYAVSYRLAQYDDEFDVGKETGYRNATTYYDPDYDLWMVYDIGRTTTPSQFLTFIRGSDGMILGYLPGQYPPPVVFQP